MAPDQVLFAAAATRKPFDDPLDWRETGSSIDVDVAYGLEARGLSPAALKLIDVDLNANSHLTYSMINLWRTLKIYRRDCAAGPSEKIVGGPKRLPEAMAKSLADVRTGWKVQAITAGAGRAGHRGNGSRQAQRRFCHCRLSDAGPADDQHGSSRESGDQASHARIALHTNPPGSS
jgi:hypothetical protein